MFAPGNQIFLFIPTGAKQRVLHPGRIIEATAENVVALFEEKIRPTVGAQVNVYGHVNGKFFQQAASVAALLADGATPTIAFNLAGQPVSAEGRQVFRVSTAAADILTCFGDEKRCKTLDVSAVGLGLVAGDEHKIGATLPVALEHEGQKITTAARVQTIKQRDDGAFRYGLLVTQNDKDALRALQQLSGAIQRKQLRRRSGAA